MTPRAPGALVTLVRAPRGFRDSKDLCDYDTPEVSGDPVDIKVPMVLRDLRE